MAAEKPLFIGTRTFADLGFVVAAEAHEAWANFRVYEIVGFLDGWAAPIFAKKGARTSLDTVDVLEEAQVFAHGSVKWDGCSNWMFDIQELGYLHMCRKEDLQNIGNTLAACWNWAGEIVPKWAPY